MNSGNETDREDDLPENAGEDSGVSGEAAVNPEVEAMAELTPEQQQEVGDRVSLLVEARRQDGLRQEEMPFAFVAGKAVTDLPKDLYIPPDALEVFLEAFEGPLDLLLYLIKRQNIDILEINVSDITDQYISYVELMEAAQFELAAEYLVMAAMLAEIKSRILLPRTSDEDEEEEDPRAQLIRRLQEYERFREAAESLDEYPRLERDIHLASVEAPKLEREIPQPDVDLKEILQAFATVLRRSDLFEHHHIQRDSLSTREKMSQILLTISDNQFTPMLSLLRRDEGRMGVVVTFLAIMELIKEALIDIAQSEPFGPIHIKARTT
jgi:segregation and condensation protein A